MAKDCIIYYPVLVIGTFHHVKFLTLKFLSIILYEGLEQVIWSSQKEQGIVFNFA